MGVFIVFGGLSRYGLMAGVRKELSEDELVLPLPRN
jgi:hypothetical protein